MMRALLVGKEPGMDLGFQYVQVEPYDTVVIGSLTLNQLLRFGEESVLEALAEGKPVYLYTPGLPEAPKNRALAGSLTAAQRELKNWGVLFTDGGRKRLITAEEARILRSSGRQPAPGAVQGAVFEALFGYVLKQHPHKKEDKKSSESKTDITDDADHFSPSSTFAISLRLPEAVL